MVWGEKLPLDQNGLFLFLLARSSNPNYMFLVNYKDNLKDKTCMPEIPKGSRINA